MTHPSSAFISDVPADQALQAWQEACVAAGCPPRVPAMRVPVGQAVGRVTAEPVWALRSSPAFDSAGMDGIAVRAAETVGAGETTPVLLAAGEFEVIDTGDPLPAGYDAVVIREHVHHTAEGRAELRAAVPPYPHVRTIGEDISASELLLPVGHRLRPVDVAACAAAGATELTVRRRPRVVIVPTGDEIRPVGTDVAPGEIVDTNSLMLAAQAGEIGCDTQVTPIVGDDPRLITDTLRESRGRSRSRDPHRRLQRRTRRLHGKAWLPKPAHWQSTGWRSSPVIPSFSEPSLAQWQAQLRHRCSESLATPCPQRSPSTSSQRHCWPRSKGLPAGATGSRARLARSLLVDRHRRLGAGSARSRRRRRHRHPVLSGPAADIAGARKTDSSSYRRGWKDTTPASRFTSSCYAGSPRSAARSWPSAPTTSSSTSLVGIAVCRSADHAGLVQRRFTGRPRGASRRAVPHRWITPARPRHR